MENNKLELISSKAFKFMKDDEDFTKAYLEHYGDMRGYEAYLKGCIDSYLYNCDPLEEKYVNNCNSWIRIEDYVFDSDTLWSIFQDWTCRDSIEYNNIKYYLDTRIEEIESQISDLQLELENLKSCKKYLK